MELPQPDHHRNGRAPYRLNVTSRNHHVANQTLTERQDLGPTQVRSDLVTY
jgi:hypothetical protein